MTTSRMRLLRIASILFVFLISVAQAQRPWQITGRLQSGVEYDSNIYESPSRVVEASVARFLMQTRATRTTPQWRVTLDYAGALLLYESARDENKLMQDANAGLMWSHQSGVRFYARGQGHLKLYLENPTDYGMTSGALGALLPVLKNSNIELGLETGQLDYARGDDFDFTFNGALVTLRYRFSNRLLGEFGVTQRDLNYQRPSFLNSPNNLEAITQHDDFSAMRLAASYNARLLLQARVEAQRNRSNRHVFDYNRVQAHLLLGYPLVQKWLLRASLLLQRKRYLTEGPQVSLPELDPEREQSNHIIIDVTRELSATATLLLRWTRHNNESPVRSLFYRKNLLFAGFELRL